VELHEFLRNKVLGSVSIISHSMGGRFVCIVRGKMSETKAFQRWARIKAYTHRNVRR
jgi:triacylglycerol esterase/lipase EstA (alpha/beta hydrolase family)